MSPLPHFQAELLQLGHQLYLFAGIGKKPLAAIDPLFATLHVEVQPAFVELAPAQSEMAFYE